MSSFCQRVEEICPLLFSVLSIMGKIQQINKRATPIIVTLGIVLSVVFGSYDTAKATGMEEFFYYTYFDLMSGLFAETGAHFGLKDDYYTKSDRVSGKQVWDNFCTWVENKAKVAALPVEVVNKTVFDELKNLPNTVTSAGVKMSEKLSELLAKVLPQLASDSSYGSGNYPELSSFKSAAAIIAAVCGTSVSAVPEYLTVQGRYLQIFTDGNVIDICTFSDPVLLLGDGYFEYVTGGGSGATYGIKYSNGSYSTGEKIYPFSSYSWIVKNGLIASDDGTSINDYANVKTLHDGSVWVPGEGFKDSWAVWDAIKDNVTTDEEEKAWNSRYNFDNDNKDDKEKKKKDNEKDKLPVAIPIIPFKKPDSSDKDKDTEQSTEKTSASPIINPKTGNVIDPETGYDIDPETGKLIDPKTGKLIDRDMSDTPSKLLKYGDVRKIFPFCIPFDIVDMIRGLRAEKAPPVFHFNYYFKGIDYTFTVDVDLSDYEKYVKLFRGGMVIFFVLALMWLTVKVSKFFS